MNKLLVQNCESKFFRNVGCLSIDNYQIINTNIHNNLYSLYYTNNITHALFKAELVTVEIIQFINDFSQSNVKCFIHHDTVVHPILNQLSNGNILHLSNKEHKDCVTIPVNLVNTNVFFNNRDSRSDSIVCFCEYNILPEFLNDYLYPKTKLPIKLFNNARVSHYQNLGLISEYDRAKILQTNKYYLALNNDDPYILEAQHCGSIVLQIADLNMYDQIQYSKPASYIEYSDFVKDNLL